MRVIQTSDEVRYRPLFNITSQANRKFCELHGIPFRPFVGLKQGDQPWHATFNRIPLLSELIEDGYRGWVLYLDADSYVYDLNFDITAYLAQNERWSVIGAPGGAGRWQANAGILFFNLSRPAALEVVAEWRRLFEEAYPGDRLHGLSDWPEGMPDDQSLLHRLMHERSDHEDVLKLEPLTFFGGSSSSFIRQVLRIHGDFERRCESAQQDVSAALAQAQRVLPNEASPRTGDGVDTKSNPGPRPDEPITSQPNLTALANKYGSDKGTKLGGPPHRYTYLYDLILDKYRNMKISLLEIGLAVGGPEIGGPVDRSVVSPSVQMWLDYFPNAHIFGFDISDFSHMKHSRFTFVRGDAGSEKDVDRLANETSGYDVIIDDGSHASYHQQLTFRHLFPKLRPGGTYIIEDLQWQSPYFEDQYGSLPKTAEFLISYFENGRYIPNSLLSEAFMSEVARSLGSFAWFPAFNGDASPPKVAIFRRSA